MRSRAAKGRARSLKGQAGLPKAEANEAVISAISPQALDLALIEAACRINIAEFAREISRQSAASLSVPGIGDASPGLALAIAVPV